MAFSEMSSRERTTIIVLVVVIGLAVIGIGILAARFLIGNGEDETAITAPAPTTEVVESSATVTLAVEATPEGSDPGSAQSAAVNQVEVVQVKNSGPLLPVMLTQHPLDGQRQYRMEIVAANGSTVSIKGNWSQSTTSAGGDLDLSLPENFEGETPLLLDLDPGIDNPKEWLFSVSVSPKDLLGDPPLLILTIWDVTGSD